MRIGEVNQDNYREYLKLLGAKDTKENDDIIIDRGTSKTDPFGNERVLGSDGYETAESVLQRMIKLGYVTEGMYVNEGDTSWKRNVSVPESVKKAIIDKYRDVIATNANGTWTEKQGNELAAIIVDYARTLPPSERLSATWTLEQIGQAEGSRIGDYIKSQMPGWKPGEPIDSDVLARAVSGEHFDTKA